jgi:hypothetical protein
MLHLKNYYEANIELINISTDDILLMTPIWRCSAFFTSPDIKTIRQGLPNLWIQNNLFLSP